MLKLEQLTKTHEGGFTLGPLNIQAKSGASVAIFGRNGAGKSTMFSIISGNADRTSGTAYWNDQKISPDAVAIKQKIGYLPQESDLPHWVTPNEIVSWCAKLHNLPASAVEYNLKLWDALPWQNKPLISCSHGMQKRIGLALATMHDPELLILDEAFNALDIFHTRTLEKLIKNRTSRQMSTFISTHTPLIAASLCDEAWIMDGGKIDIIADWPACDLQARAHLIEHRFFQDPISKKSETQKGKTL